MKLTKKRILVIGIATTFLALIALMPLTQITATYGLREITGHADNVTIQVFRTGASIFSLTYWEMVLSGYWPQSLFPTTNCNYKSNTCYSGTWFLTWTHNKIINTMGLTWLSNKIHTSSYENTTTIAQYIGLSSDATAPAFTDFNLASEITTNNLGRAVCGTLTIGTASGGAITNTCVITFTDNTATTSNIQKAGWFLQLAGTHCSASATYTSGGCMYAENTFASTTLNVNDQLQLTWTDTYTST